MSETDDTDVLVLVPPDLFLVETDSDDSIYVPTQYHRARYESNDDYSIKNIVASDLVNQVNNLESRISLIENTNRDIFTETHAREPPYGDSNSYQFFDENDAKVRSIIPHSASTRLGGSSESLKIQSLSRLQSTPIKSKQLYSLPSTPNNQKLDFDLQEQKPRFLSRSRFPQNSRGSSIESVDYFEQGNMPSTESTSRNGDGNYSKTGNNSNNNMEGYNKTAKHSRYNSELMDEIDQFLDNVKRTPQSLKRPVSEYNRRENLYKCGELSSSVPDLNFGVRDLNSLPVREEPVIARYFTPLEPQSGTEHNRLSLPEIDRLLKEMESTQFVIEQKLRMKEAEFGKGQGSLTRDTTSLPHRPSQCGDNSGSVPDLGFGLRDLPSAKPDDPRVPVHEDRVIKRSMSLCGMNPNEQSNTNSTNQPKTKQSANQTRSEENVPRKFTPRKLELGGDPNTIPDLGFGLINWYKSNDAESDLEEGSVKPGLVSQETLDKPTGKFIQGEDPSSIPDLGFGLRDLWGTGGQSVGSSASRQQTNPQAANDQRLNASKYTLRSQNEPSKSSTLEHGSVYKPQENRENKSSESPITKKVNFAVESGVRDSMSLEGDYGRGKPAAGSSTNLLSLTNLWSAQGIPVNSEHQKDSINLTQKLEEEKYRREHCERLIQELQSRLLEEQQKLAVAVQVDTGKDQAIQHFHGAWTSLVLHWKELEEQRHNLSLELQRDREHYQKSIADTLHTLKRYESEVSKALDLAQGYKQKCDTIARETYELRESDQQEIQKLRAAVQEREEAVAKANKENGQIVKEKDKLLEKITHLEDESKKDKTIVVNIKKELDKKSKALSSNEADTAALKEEKSTLQLTLREEKARNNLLDQQKKTLQSAVDDSKKKEKLMREEIKSATCNMDKLKTELRDFYQEQVEIVVRDKLAEFQEQLDAAERSLRSELEAREQAITEMAAKQVKQIADKHQLEVKLLEEKHKEELQLYQLKLAQSTQHTNKLHNKLKSYNNRKGEIAEQLHDVMETQWQKALRIIHGNSPMASQAQSARTQAGGTNPSFSTWPMNGPSQAARDPVPTLQLSQQTAAAADDGPRTYRVPQDFEHNGPTLEEHDLKKYIDMLLNRSPGNPVLDDKPSSGQWQNAKQNGKEDGRQRDTRQVPTNDTNKLPHWEKVDQSDNQQHYRHVNGQLFLPEFDLSRISAGSVSKDSKSDKPPWK